MYKILKAFSFLLILMPISCQSNGRGYFGENSNYEILFNEIYCHVRDNFASPFDSNKIHFFHDSEFGITKNQFSNKFMFQDFSIINCDVNENIYSMTDGKIKKIVYNGFSWTIIVRNNDIEIYYILLTPINIKEGNLVKKGQLIGNAKQPYSDQYDGAALILKIKYKKYFFDPYLLLYDIIEKKEMDIKGKINCA
jgi:hypothetical protein